MAKIPKCRRNIAENFNRLQAARTLQADLRQRIANVSSSSLTNWLFVIENAENFSKEL